LFRFNDFTIRSVIFGRSANTVLAFATIATQTLAFDFGEWAFAGISTAHTTNKDGSLIGAPRKSK
jgi:hypothetical protein